jgi:hypothetical protein
MMIINWQRKLVLTLEHQKSKDLKCLSIYNLSKTAVLSVAKNLKINNLLIYYHVMNNIFSIRAAYNYGYQEMIVVHFVKDRLVNDLRIKNLNNNFYQILKLMYSYYLLLLSK